jgi:hypothetical protein
MVNKILHASKRTWKNAKNNILQGEMALLQLQRLDLSKNARHVMPQGDDVAVKESSYGNVMM